MPGAPRIVSGEPYQTVGSHWSATQRPMKNLLVCLLSLTALSAFAVPVTIENPSFELPTSQANFNTVFTGGSGIPGWSVSAGSVDHIAKLWQASDGLRSVDMSGSSAGTLQQGIWIPSAGLLNISFDLAGNPGGTGTSIKTLQVSLLGSTTASQVFTFDAALTSTTDMGWVTSTAWFDVPVSGTYILQFASLTPGLSGPALDNVSASISANGSANVPDPGATLLMLGMGLAAVGAVRRTLWT